MRVSSMTSGSLTDHSKVYEDSPVRKSLEDAIIVRRGRRGAPVFCLYGTTGDLGDPN